MIFNVLLGLNSGQGGQWRQITTEGFSTDGRPQYHTCLTKDGLQSICTVEDAKGFGYLRLSFVRLSLFDNVKDPHSEVLAHYAWTTRDERVIDSQ